MSERVYAAGEEKRILDILGRALLRDFPNPERIGCLDPALLKGIASHKVPLDQADRWLDHLTSCSPCYRDFVEFHEGFRRRRLLILVAVVASVLLAVGVWGCVLYPWAAGHARGSDGGFAIRLNRDKSH